MALIGQGVNPVPIDYSMIGNDAWRVAQSNVSAIGGVIDAVKDRRDKKDTIKTSKKLAEAMSVLYPESAKALGPVIAELNNEESPLSQRAALGAQIGDFINMGVQKSRDNALMNLEAQRLGLEGRRVAIAEALPQMEQEQAQRMALSDNDLKVDQAIATAMATADAAKMAKVQLPEETTSLINQYLEAGNGPAALAAAEAQAKAIEKFITPQGGKKLTTIGGTDAAGMPIDINAFVTPSGELFDIQGQPLNQPATDGMVLPPRDDVPQEQSRRTAPMPNMPTIGIRPSGTPTPRTPTQQALDETRLRLAEQEVKTAESAVAKEQSTKQASLANAEDAVKLIETLKTHPGFEAAVGSGFSKTVLRQDDPIRGTERAGAVAIIDQLKGQAFLNAIQQLRGLGALSDAEGAKLQQAAARLDPNQSEKDFNAALEEYKTMIQAGIERAKAGQLAPGVQPAPSQSASDRLKAAKARLGQ